MISFNFNLNMGKMWNSLSEDKRKYWAEKYMTEKGITGVDFDRVEFINWLTDRVFEYLKKY